MAASVPKIFAKGAKPVYRVDFRSQSCLVASESRRGVEARVKWSLKVRMGERTT